MSAGGKELTNLRAWQTHSLSRKTVRWNKDFDVACAIRVVMRAGLVAMVLNRSVARVTRRQFFLLFFCFC